MITIMAFAFNSDDSLYHYANFSLFSANCNDDVSIHLYTLLSLINMRDSATTLSACVYAFPRTFKLNEL